MVFSLCLMIFSQKNACCVVLTPKWQLANVFLLRISMQSEWKLANSNCRIVIHIILFSIFFHNFAQYFANQHQGDFGRRRRTRFQPRNENGKKEKVFGLWRSGKVENVVLSRLLRWSCLREAPHQLLLGLFCTPFQRIIDLYHLSSF